MSVTMERLVEPRVRLGTIFDRIVCGVDGSESSRAAVVQAARLLAARRVLELVTVVENTPVGRSELLAPSQREQQYEAAQCALREGHELCGQARSMVLFGEPGRKLVSAAAEFAATLVVVGAPVSGRHGRFVLWAAGTHVLHNAPCSVLIARQPPNEDTWPRSIVVGYDGSAGAEAAALVAKELAYRFQAALRIVVATGGEPVDVDSLPFGQELEWSASRPVDALVTASLGADLLVVGSRGFRSNGDQGSVSERIGHLAHCSVLVVREKLEFLRMETGVADEVPDSEC